MAESKKPKQNIYQRMLVAQEHAAYIQKEFVKAVRHFAVSHDDVTKAAREALMKAGVYVQVDTKAIDQFPVVRKYRSGEVENTYTRVGVELTFVNIDDPEDRFSSTFWGDGEGADNKSPGAAYSFAVKTALLKSLLIPTGEQEESAHIPERDQVTEPAQAATPDERDQFFGALKDQLCADKGWNYNDVLSYIEALYDEPLVEWPVEQLRAGYNAANKKYKPSEEQPNE